jgi:GxxExxY protein
MCIFSISVMPRVLLKMHIRRDRCLELKRRLVATGIMRLTTLSLCMIAASLFLDSLLVSAFATPVLGEMRKTIPYLRNRCVSGVNPTPVGRAVPTCNPFVRAGSFHRGGRTLSSHDGIQSDAKRLKVSDEHARVLSSGQLPPPGDVVKRFKIPDTVARGASTPHKVITVDRPEVAPMSTPVVKPWSIEWSNLLEAAGEVYFEMGEGHSEKSYQLSLLYRLYQSDVACLVERNVYVTENNMSILVGRVDLEVNKRFLLELKVSPPTAANLRKDMKQLRRYVAAYKANGAVLERAALVYFGNFEVRIVEVPVTEPTPEQGRSVTSY